MKWWIFLVVDELEHYRLQAHIEMEHYNPEKYHCTLQVHFETECYTPEICAIIISTKYKLKDIITIERVWYWKDKS